MSGRALVREARRRAGLSQGDIAERLGTTQSAIARLERGRVEPSFERVVGAIRACGLDFVPQLTSADGSDWSVAVGNLQLTRDERVRRHGAALRFARAGREALARGRA